MKLVTFSQSSPTGSLMRIGALVGGDVIDLNLATRARLEQSQSADRAGEISDGLVPANMNDFLLGGNESLEQAKRAIDFALGAQSSGPGIVQPLSRVKLHAPVPRPNSIRDTISFEKHMLNFERRTGRPTPKVWYERPIYYKGNPDSVIGPEDDIIWPSYTDKLDYELEFAVVVNRKGKNLSVEEAGHVIAGYTIFNDVSARDIIPLEVSANLGPAKGKDFDTGNIIGPWLVTADEIDPADLEMEARINSETWSRGHSSDMFWSFAQIVSFMSQDETLHPGDLIGSGTVANGCGDEMDRWIKPGDVIELEVKGLGVLRNKVVRHVGAS